jgi:hypothetical protein
MVVMSANPVYLLMRFCPLALVDALGSQLR